MKAIQTNENILPNRLTQSFATSRVLLLCLVLRKLKCAHHANIDETN